MKRKISRFGYVIAAMGLAVVVVIVLTYAGGRSTGPLGDLLHSTGVWVSQMESNIVMRNRKERRAKALKWLEPYRQSTAQLLDPMIILLGAYDNETTQSYGSIIELEQSLETVFPLIHIYAAWGDKPEQRFPAAHVRAIHDLGSIPFITWEPWLTDFDGELHTQLPPGEERDKNGLADIAHGKYDFYLERWAAEARNARSPLFVRLGHEMNDAYRYPWGPQNNTAEDFVRAWRYVHTFFDSAGARNVIWVWSPHPAYQQFDSYYPGSDYVDWIGIGTLNYGIVASWSKWWTFEEIFGNYYPELAKFNKPIILTEFASLPVGGDRAEWYNQALYALPQRYPQVKGLMFFHFSNDNTTTYKALNWYIKDDSTTVNAIVEAIAGWPAEVRPPIDSTAQQ